MHHRLTDNEVVAITYVQKKKKNTHKTATDCLFVLFVFNVS